jgi:hypothetical protein
MPRVGDVFVGYRAPEPPHAVEDRFSLSPDFFVFTRPKRPPGFY